jgi:very-short-patch-repair endonuclease
MNDKILNNCGYNKKLQPLAAKLRKSMTKAEACLWKYVLKGKQLKGYQFRRQRPTLHYIADFLCKDLMLIIEIDGITHDDEETVVKDRQRENGLKAAGFKIVRFTDEEVLKNLAGVTDHLELLIDKIETSTPNPRQRGTIAVDGSRQFNR